MPFSANAVVFPFDCFGSAGTGEGAKLLGDALNEAIEDEALEDQETRPRSYTRGLTIGEVEFNTPESLMNWREVGTEHARELLAEKAFLLWLSGNHLGVLPVFDSLSRDTLIIQLDAHLDIYNFHDTTEELCHGNFLRHRLTDEPRIVNIGHRDLFLMPEELDQFFAETIPAEQLAADFANCLKRLRLLAKGAKRIWIDLDVDVIDPSFAPAVHTPMPYGVLPQQLLAILEAIGWNKLTGLSVSEFDPGRDVRDQTLNLLGWLLEWVLLKKSS